MLNKTIKDTFCLITVGAKASSINLRPQFQFIISPQLREDVKKEPFDASEPDQRSSPCSHIEQQQQYKQYKKIIMSTNGQCPRLSLDSLRKKIQNYCYSHHDKLGSGYSSEVFKGLDVRTGKTVAIKVVNLHKIREKGLEDLLMREIKFLQELRHQNLVYCLDALMTNNNCYIVTDHCAQGDLSSFLAKKGRLGLDEGLKLIRDIVAAVSHLHEKGVMHRDIKPHNILLHNGRPKLADFGFAVRSEVAIKQKYKIGSPLYMSPEALVQKEYSKKNDVWALGVTIYEILEGRAPWQARDEKQLKNQFKSELRFKHVHHPQLQQLIKGCLTFNHNQRLSIDRVLIKIEEMMGLGSNIKWQGKDNKENEQTNGNKEVGFQQSQQFKKQMRNNYNLLKWLVNYSRFVAKLLPKLQQLSLSKEQGSPLTQFAARALHMTISKLTKIDQTYAQLQLTNFSHFRRTSRFSKIKAVSAQYYQKYFLLLTKLPYKYSLPPALFVDFPQGIAEVLQKLSLINQCNQQNLKVIGSMLTLIQANLLAKENTPTNLSRMINFQLLIEALPQTLDQQRVSQLIVKKNKLVERLKSQGQELKF